MSPNMPPKWPPAEENNLQKSFLSVLTIRVINTKKRFTKFHEKRLTSFQKEHSPK